MDVSLTAVRQALTLPDFDVHSAWARMIPQSRRMRRPIEKPGNARQAGVLVLLYHHAGELTFVLTRRTDTLSSHSWQISLPGGRHEPQDDTTQETALREACEEIGICTVLDVLCSLTPLYVNVSDFEVTPYVAYTADRPAFNIDPVEVAYVIEMPVRLLLDDTIKDREQWNLHGYDLDVPFYRYGEHVIWGATAIMLSEFEGRLRTVMNTPT
ncbi:MAG: NUDIX hydrolase [Anaerolineae bacterium]